MKLKVKNKTENSLFIILHNFIKLLKVPLTNNVLKQVISENNNDGSIRTICDLLLEFNIESKVFRVEYEDLLRIPCPIIAQIEVYNTQHFVVISDVTTNKINYFNTCGKECYESDTIFDKKW